MSEFITFGETMMVFSPHSAGPLRYNHFFTPRIAGAESNTAIGVSKLGHSAAWFSRVGADEMGKFLINSIRAEGVDVSCVQEDPERPTGIMIKELTFRGDTRVTYYRENSAFTTLRPKDIPTSYFKDSRIFHCTGITPVLSEQSLETLENILDLCTYENIFVSFDPNIRKKLWKDRSFSEILIQIIEKTSCLMLGLDEAETLFHSSDPQALSGLLFRKYPRLKYIALKNGSHGAYAISQDEFVFLPPYPCSCVDPVGAGDAFNAGFLAGLLDNRPLKECGQMGAICGALCTQTTGDIEGIPDRDMLVRLLNHTKEDYR